MTALADKPDHELVADARMVADELSGIRQELVSRGIESNVFTYEGGKVRIKDFERVTREAL